MIDKLLEEVFAKVGRITGNETENGRAAHLEEIISEEFKTPITARSLVRYLKKESKPRLDVLDALAKYLEFDNYEDFVSRNSSTVKAPVEIIKGDSKRIKEGVKLKTKNIWMAFVALIIGNLAYIGLINDEECMVWVNDHYEKCECTGQAMEFELNETEVENFKKVKVCDTTKFFEKYDAIIWYDKYNNRIEYFTYYGKNPLNGRTLRPITQTIIDNHVLPCDITEKL